MITDLRRLLGPEHQRRINGYLAWLVGYGVLQGLAMALLVPLLRALLAGDVRASAGWLLWLLAACAATCVAHYVQAMKGFAVALIVLRTMHTRLGDHVASLPLGWFSTERVGRLSRTATSGTMMVGGITAHLLQPLVVGITTPATIALVTLVFDWRLGVAMLACAPLIHLAFRAAARLVGDADEHDDAAAVAAGNRVVEFARAQQVLRAFGRGVRGYPPLEQAIVEQRRVARRGLWRSVAGLLVGGFSVQLTFTVLVVVGALLALGGTVEVVQLVAVIALAARFTGPLAEVGELAGAVRIARNDLARLVAVLREPPLPEPATSAPLGAPGEIEFDGVEFGYPQRPVLRGASFRVPARSMTALVGASGAGKTTVTRLIARFFDVDAGVVRVGGADVRDLATAELMGQLALVFQDVYLFEDTLEANVRLGRPDATDEELARAARLAGVDEIVARLPDGWRTRVAEGGAALSGGERQRVSIARAILKDAPIVLLDEATAALDPENEAVVRAALRALMHRSTLLVIAHKLSTVTAADQILVLDGGRIAERGTHDDLLAAGGRYAAFWHERRRAQGWRLVPLDAANAVDTVDSADTVDVSER